MRNLLVSSLLAMITLGLSFNVIATSQEYKDKTEQKQEEVKNENEKKYDNAKGSKHKHAHKHHHKHKHPHGHKHHKKKHKSKCENHPNYRYQSQRYQYREYPDNQGNRNSDNQGDVKNVEPRVPEDNSGKKMEMDEYSN